MSVQECAIKKPPAWPRPSEDYTAITHYMYKIDITVRCLRSNECDVSSSLMTAV